MCAHHWWYRIVNGMMKRERIQNIKRNKIRNKREGKDAEEMGKGKITTEASKKTTANQKQKIAVKPPVRCGEVKEKEKKKTADNRNENRRKEDEQ
jgi:hypothetical protein